MKTKKMVQKKKWWVIITMLLCSTTVSAFYGVYDFEVDGICYDITSEEDLTVSVAGLYDWYESIIVPNEVIYDSKTYRVTSINTEAFWGCDFLTSVIISDGITSIGDYAFQECYSLTDITFPNTLEYVGRDVFVGTSWYHNLPDGVIYIGNVFYEYKGEMLQNMELSIKEGTMVIPSNAFSGCDGLTSITIPNSVTSIGSNAFSDCDGLTSITIPNSVTSIGSKAFSNCDGLTSITIPNSITSIENNTFAYCNGLTSITIPNSITSIENNAFYGCNGLTSITIPDGVTKIGNEAFYGCHKLLSITLPNTLVDMGSDVFEGTAWYENQPDGLVYLDEVLCGYKGTLQWYQRFSIKEGTKIIAANTFNGKYVSSVTIPEGVTSIGHYAFSGSSIESITLPKSVTWIGSYAFSGCDFWTINIPKGVVSIEDGTFYECRFLSSIVIPEGVTKIGDRAFGGCFLLSSITIPESLIDISSNMFYDANLSRINIASINSFFLLAETFSNASHSNSVSIYLNGDLLKEIVVPSSVTSIPDYTFKNCKDLTSITFHDGVTTIGYSAFEGCSNLTSISIPEGVSWILPSTFSDCSSLTSITIPESVVMIAGNVFEDCDNLTEIMCLSSSPPAVYVLEEKNIFIPDAAVVYVPNEALDLYLQSDVWKEYNIQPLTLVMKGVDLTVSLPADAVDGRYKNMFLELCNVSEEKVMKYIITDRTEYTFSNISNETKCNITIKNASGAILGSIDEIGIGYEDVEIAFESLLQPRNITLDVQAPDGTDVTSQTQIRWFDSANNYLQQGNKLSGLLAGTAVRYSIKLPQALGMQYVLPTDSVYTIQEEGNALVCTLHPLEEVTICGRVKDVTTGSTLSGAVVSVSQKLNGLYSKAFTVKTDNKGGFTVKVFNDQSTITVSASDYLNQTLTFSNFNDTTFVGEVALKSITGATITTNLTYTTSVVEGGMAEVQNWYADYANVAYEIYNETQQRAITQFNVQYPSIVLLEEVAEGDLLTLTASSRTNAFVPVKATATIDAQNRAEATFNIVELGAIRAKFTSTDNSSVVGILYDGKGQLVKKYTYGSASLSISNLAEGDYTLVSMTNSSLFNSILNLSQFAASGLKEGVDYVQNAVTVKSGVVATISNDLIPVLDESKLYYTGDNTLFSVNKTSIVAGNYLTLKGKIDFKRAYSSKVSNVNMVVDLPESCSFVENSVMVGSNISSYTLDGNRLTIPLTGKYTDQVRFCVIPTAGGDYAPSAFAQFTLDNKEVLQPIGNAKFVVKDLTISVPSTVAKTAISISGTALGNSTIEIFDNGVKIGETTSLANGEWSTTCELDEPYNLSMHSIYAKVTTKQGLELQSETQECMYDRNIVTPEKVTMLYYNPEFVGQYNIVFDFINRSVSPKSYYFFPYKSYPNWWGSGTEPKDFTFVADLSNNDSTAVNGVTIRVYTDNGNWRNLEAQYNTSMNRWIAVSQFTEQEAPVGVEVEIEANSPVILDADILNGSLSYLSNVKEDIVDKTDYINSIWNDFKQKLKESDNQGQLDLCKSQLFEALGIIKDGSSSITAIEDPFDELLKVGDSLLVDSLTLSIDPILQTNIQNFKSEIESLGILKLTDCGSISENYIIENDFVGYEKTDGTIFYVLANEETYEIVDFNINLHAVVLNTNSAESSRILVKSKRSADDIFDIINSNAEKIEKACDRLKSIVSMISNAIGHATNLIEGHNLKLTNQLAELVEKQVYFATHRLPFNAKIVEAQCDALVKTIQANDNIVDLLKNCDAKLKFSPKMSVSTKVGRGFAIFDIIYNGYKVANTYRELANLYSGIMPCKGDEANAKKLQSDIRNLAIQSGAYFISQFVAAGISLAGVEGSIMAAIPTGGASVSTAIVSIGLAVANFAVSVAYEKHYEKSVNKLEKRKRELKCEDNKCPRCGKDPCECPDKCPKCGNSPCTCPDKCPKCGENPCECPPPPFKTEAKHDPSGYVYEGVASNRLQGVMASCYYKETVEDMYGDLHDNVVLWNAEEYAQENPLFTDEYGMYRWDVPKGLWQVKFEKEGYQTTYSEWLPVPPPQLEVNIAMTQNKQPEVVSARAYEDGIEVEFDKYMQLDGLTTENIFVTKNGETAAGTVTLLNEEQAYEDNPVKYASKVRFVPETSFLTTDEVTLTVSRKVKSYAGIQMEEDYMQSFDIEKEVKSIVADSLIKVAYNGDKEITVSALPYDAAIGKKMIVNNSSSMIAAISADTLTLDEKGQASLTLSGDLPGTVMLTFTLAETDVKALSTVQVVIPELKMTAAPKATRASGTAVYRGTEVGLTCETEGAVIYYTLDGSCPCDENAPRLIYETPIAITEDMTIKAMAVVEDRDESEVAEFSFTIKRTNLGMELKEGWNWVSHNMETEVPTTALPQQATRIVGQTAELVSDPAYGLIGNLKTLQPDKAYKVQMGADFIHVMSGYEFNPATSISLKNGWNWLGYPVSQTMSLKEAFVDMQPDNEDYIVGQDGFAQYADGVWTGTLQTLNPGMGYLYYSHSTKTFVYNSTIVSKARAVYGRRAKNKTPWTVDKNKYPNVMPLVADVYVEDQKMAAGSFAVGAFCGTECRGVGKYVNGRLMMNIYGEANEKITFRAVNYETEEMFDIAEQMTFTETLQGSLYLPYALNVGNATGIAEAEAAWKVWLDMSALYLSLNGNGFDRVTLTDAYGNIALVKEHVADGEAIRIAPLADGVYIVTAEQNGQMFYKKIVKTGK